MQGIPAKYAVVCDIIAVTETEGGVRIMPILTMQVPVDADVYYRGETLARDEGMSLYDKFNEWLDDYVEDAQLPVDTLEALKESKETLRRRHRAHRLQGSDWDGAVECHVGNAGDWIAV